MKLRNCFSRARSEAIVRIWGRLPRHLQNRPFSEAVISQGERMRPLPVRAHKESASPCSPVVCHSTSGALEIGASYQTTRSDRSSLPSILTIEPRDSLTHMGGNDEIQVDTDSRQRIRGREFPGLRHDLPPQSVARPRVFARRILGRISRLSTEFCVLVCGAPSDRGCLLLALNVVCSETAKRPKLGAKRTLRGHRGCVAFDPERMAWGRIADDNHADRAPSGNGRRAGAFIKKRSGRI